MKVQVLMSVYNSVNFLSEQLDTVLAQTGVECSLLIRDDGSENAEMKAIIDEYILRYPNRIVYYSGRNMRPAKSFIDLIKHSDPDCDYYAFCDHDDLWDEDKLVSAIELLKTLPQDKPNCCFCKYRTCDAQGKVIGKMNVPEGVKFSKTNILLANPAPGCCMVFNQMARSLISEKETPECIVMHDNWLILMCAMLGSIVFDPRERISYRQHGNNVVGVAGSFAEKLKFKYKYIVSAKHRSEHANQARCFLRLYGHLVTDNQCKNILTMLCGYDQSFLNRMKLVCTHHLVSYNVKMTLYFKLAILLNRW